MEGTGLGLSTTVSVGKSDSTSTHVLMTDFVFEHLHFLCLCVSLSAEEQQEHHVHKQQKRREGKRPEQQHYQPVAGHGQRHRDSEEGETGQSDPLTADSYEHDQPSHSEKTGLSEKDLERHGCTDGGTSTDKREEDRMRGDGSNTQNCRKGSQSQAKTEANQAKGSNENVRELQEPARAAKQTKKARKPDREFYQPGSRRNVQGKDCGVGREQDKPPPRKHEQKTEPESQLSTGEKEGNKKTSIQEHGRKDKEVKGVQENVKLSKSSETNRKQGCRDVEKPQLRSDASVEKITSKVEKLSVKEKGSVGCEGQDVEELSCRRGEMMEKEKRGQGGGTKEDEEKVEKKRERGNRRRRGGEKEKERNQDFRRGEDEVGGGGKGDWGKAEKERDRKATEADRDNKPGKTGERHQSKGRENRRESRRGDNNNNRSRDAEKDAKTQRNVDRTVERGDGNKSNANITTPTSKRYSKSDIRRSRNRTYSSSSASSVTSHDGPGQGMDVESTKWPRLEPMHNHKEGITNSGQGRRSHLQSWTTNGESSTEGSEMSDITEDRRRRRRGGEEELSAERRREERNRPKGNKGGGRGILRVSLEKQSGSSSHSAVAQQRKQGVVPRGRGGGILVLPARTDISNSPEVGQRLLFGGIRGGAASRSRGGRGGGVRRLWDPNNPDQKPALTTTQSSQHSPLQPIYLQTGTGYGQLHFLDTDDEVAGSPPVPQGEHFRSKQAAAMAYYKFQNSDNPYGYPMPTSNPHNPTTATSQRYPYPYHMGPYQMSPTNGMYPGPGVGQFCGTYRGAGYSQPGAGGVLTLEEAEQQARGELVRLLRAADAHELQLSNLLSRDRVSADGLDRMAQFR